MPATRVSSTCGMAAASPVPAARTSAAERDPAIEGKREHDGSADCEKAVPERGQRPLKRRELHGRSLVASSHCVKGADQ